MVADFTLTLARTSSVPRHRVRRISSCSLPLTAYHDYRLTCACVRSCASERYCVTLEDALLCARTFAVYTATRAKVLLRLKLLSFADLAYCVCFSAVFVLGYKRLVRMINKKIGDFGQSSGTYARERGRLFDVEELCLHNPETFLILTTITVLCAVKNICLRC